MSKESPEKSINQRVQALINLSSQYKGSENIPDEELAELGYHRSLSEDGSVRLIPQERLVDLEKRSEDWEKSVKAKERPFERIAVMLPSSENSFRFIPKTQRKQLREKMSSLEDAFNPYWYSRNMGIEAISDSDQRVHNLRTFILDLSEFCDNNLFTSGEPNAWLTTLCWPLPSRSDLYAEDNDLHIEFSGSNFLETHSDSTNGSVQASDSHVMYDELTRLSGYYCDKQEVIRDFKFRLHEDIFEDNDPSEYDEETTIYKEFLDSIGITTHADFTKYIFPQYLHHIGLTEMAEAIKDSDALHELGKTLSDLDAQDIPNQEEKEIRDAIKRATIEEKKLFSKRLKELESAKKKRRQIRQGVIDYFSSPDLYVETCSRKIKEVQDFLVTGKSNSEGMAQFYLDATDNRELDEDPGAFSGDCTAGKPLPFDRSDIPLYNIKVFNNDERHIGNMYLLVINTANGRKVWHFDAIQIPYSGIKWQKSFPYIVDALADEAERKEIAAITANNISHLISNYNDIGRSVTRYWQSQGKRTTWVDIPHITIPNRSHFQGTGEALVLWSNEGFSRKDQSTE